MSRYPLLASGLAALLLTGSAVGAQTGGTATAQPASAATSAFEFSIPNMMRGPELYGREPQGVSWSPDSRWIYFRWLPPGTDWRETPEPYRVRAVAGSAPEHMTEAHMDSVGPLLADGPLTPDRTRRVVAYGGQFLKLFEAELGQSLDLPPLGDEGQDCLQVFRTLMKQGNAALEPLCAGIDPNRNLKVWRKPEASNATMRLSPGGRLETRFGQPMEAPWQAVGQWLNCGNNRPLYLSSLALEPMSARVILNDK